MILWFIKAVLKKMGMDKSIAYSSGARIIQAFTGVASIFFISRYLTGIEQGFYYTFGSIVAIQVFFELGLTNIITQYIAHEASHLCWENECHLQGEQKFQSRLASLLRFSVKWYSIVALVFLAVLIVTGNIFFSRFSHESDNTLWRLPWLLISVGTVLNLFLSPLLAILMGLDKVKEVSKIRFYQQIILPVSVWIGLVAGLKLYVVGISSILAAALVVLYIDRTNLKSILWNLWIIKVTDKVDYMKEIFPYQWKIALSWISGYFIFQLFNPVLFATEGAVVAGQMGMTLAALNGIQALSMSWLNTKVPLYSRLIALKEYSQLDSIFYKTLKQMAFVCFSLLFIMFVGVFLLRSLDFRLGFRFLGYTPMLLMMVPLFANQFVNSWATYLRCHKQEPFLLNSICVGLVCCLSTVLMGKYWGVTGVTGGYCLITVLFLPWGYWIFKTKKNEWHE